MQVVHLYNEMRRVMPTVLEVRYTNSDEFTQDTMSTASLTNATLQAHDQVFPGLHCSPQTLGISHFARDDFQGTACGSWSFLAVFSTVFSMRFWGLTKASSRVIVFIFPVVHDSQHSFTNSPRTCSNDNSLLKILNPKDPVAEIMQMIHCMCIYGLPRMVFAIAQIARIRDWLICDWLNLCAWRAPLERNALSLKSR